MADSTTLTSTCHVAGFFRLFLLHKLIAWDGHCFSYETGSKVLLSEKLKQKLNPKFLAEPDVGVPLSAATVLKRSSLTGGVPLLVASGAPADAPFQDCSECALSLNPSRQWLRRSQGHFFGYFLWGLAKKVSRLPAGTGDLDVKISTNQTDFETAGSSAGMLIKS
jgi:hypothetical protein